MTGPALTLRHLSFTGPGKESALLEFGPGLNVVYGASETGKSFILEALDFMLGGNTDLRDIPERVGYDRIFLGIEECEGSAFTLERSTAGGEYRCYDGLHSVQPENVTPQILNAKHNPNNKNNVSMFLLAKLALAGKQIRRNAAGETNTLSLRNLAHLCLVSETNIQKKGPPFETGQVITRTAELSALKLLLTGVDDSAIQSTVAVQSETLSRTAKIEVIEELMADYRERLTGLVGEEDSAEQLNDQLEKLNESISTETNLLRQTEQNYREAVQRRNGIRTKLESAYERRSEIEELLARFALLNDAYNSDLKRLEGIREAGTLVVALEDKACPLCGASPERKHLNSDCDGNIDAVVMAAEAERSKVARLQRELNQTVAQLRGEANNFDSVIPAVREELSTAEEAVTEVSPALSDRRASYSELVQVRTTVQNAFNLLSSIAELEHRRIELEASSVTKRSQEPVPVELSFSVLDKFSKVMEDVLKSWNFPDADRVYFDKESRDFVISGKPRGSRGKGMRAITYAAFTVGLLEFTRVSKMPHLGFVVLDTPLLAYREPEGDEDDLTGTDVQNRFYEFLDARTDRQSIVLENVDPPDRISNGQQVTFFSRNPHSGRFGFFPV